LGPELAALAARLPLAWRPRRAVRPAVRAGQPPDGPAEGLDAGPLLS